MFKTLDFPLKEAIATWKQLKLIPSNTTTKHQQPLFIKLILIRRVIEIVLIVISLVKLYQETGKVDLNRSGNDIVIMIAIAYGMTLVYLFTAYLDEYINILDKHARLIQLSGNWTSARFLNKGYTVLMRAELLVSLVLVVIIITLKYFEKCDEQIQECGLIIMYFPFYIHEKLIRLMVNVSPCIWYSFETYMIMTFTICMVGSYYLSVSEFDIFRELIAETPKYEKSQLSLHIKRCIHYHQLMLEIWENSLEVNTPILTCQWCFTTLVMIFSAAQSVKSQIDTTNIIVQVLFFAAPNICIYLLEGHVAKKSSDLPMHIFLHFPWKGDINVQKNALFMLMRSQKPLLIPGRFKAYTRPFLLQFFKMSIFGTLFLKHQLFKN